MHNLALNQPFRRMEDDYRLTYPVSESGLRPTKEGRMRIWDLLSLCRYSFPEICYIKAGQDRPAGCKTTRVTMVPEQTDLARFAARCDSKAIASTARKANTTKIFGVLQS